MASYLKGKPQQSVLIPTPVMPHQINGDEYFKLADFTIADNKASQGITLRVAGHRPFVAPENSGSATLLMWLQGATGTSLVFLDDGTFGGFINDNQSGGFLPIARVGRSEEEPQGVQYGLYDLYDPTFTLDFKLTFDTLAPVVQIVPTIEVRVGGTLVDTYWHENNTHGLGMTYAQMSSPIGVYGGWPPPEYMERFVVSGLWLPRGALSSTLVSFGTF